MAVCDLKLSFGKAFDQRPNATRQRRVLPSAVVAGRERVIRANLPSC
jgi:hypothetical protein